jgi:hypothetical protein
MRAAVKGRCLAIEAWIRNPPSRQAPLQAIAVIYQIEVCNADFLRLT